jgi:folate-binding protein YgfZ
MLPQVIAGGAEARKPAAPEAGKECGMSGWIRLDDRAVVAVAGAEAAGFLHGIVTNSVEALTGGQAAYSGLLTPQGKLLFDFFALRDGERFLIDIAASLAADFIKRLTFYKLRAKVDIARLEGAVVCADPAGCAGVLPDAIVYPDPRLAGGGRRAIVLTGQAAASVDAEGWLRHRIDLGLPEGGKDFIYSDCFPHDIAMDQLNGIAFAKGCYVGQEVVSRMRHRGTARRRPMLVASDRPLPVAPCEITADGKTIGTIGSCLDNRGLAEVRLDFAEEALAAGKRLLAGDVPVRLMPPDWADYGDAFVAHEG